MGVGGEKGLASGYTGWGEYGGRGGVGGFLTSSAVNLHPPRKCLLLGLFHIHLTTAEFKFQLVQGALYMLPESYSWIIDFASTQEIRSRGFSIRKFRLKF